MVDKHLFGRMLNRLSNEQLGAIMRRLTAHFFGVEETGLSEIESIYYEELVQFAEQKAKNYLSQTYNSRHNNPNKKNQII